MLGVDRLDYTKGIPERLVAFGRLLELFPEWRGKVSLIQISVPSRADVPEYAEQRANIEGIVGRVNGEFGEAHWVPIRYLYRGYSRPHLSQLYRAARVGYVTPLRDGMNLVAKEYVAAQDPEDPGVLVLSQFAGAAAEMKDAILTNPYWADGMARDLDRALRMPLDERKMRHARSLAIVERTTAQSWAASFLDALSGVLVAQDRFMKLGRLAWRRRRDAAHGGGPDGRPQHAHQRHGLDPEGSDRNDDASASGCRATHSAQSRSNTSSRAIVFGSAMNCTSTMRPCSTLKAQTARGRPPGAHAAPGVPSTSAGRAT